MGRGIKGFFFPTRPSHGESRSFDSVNSKLELIELKGTTHGYKVSYILVGNPSAEHTWANLASAQNVWRRSQMKREHTRDVGRVETPSTERRRDPDESRGGGGGEDTWEDSRMQVTQDELLELHSWPGHGQHLDDTSSVGFGRERRGGARRRNGAAQSSSGEGRWVGWWVAAGGGVAMVARIARGDRRHQLN